MVDRAVPSCNPFGYGAVVLRVLSILLACSDPPVAPDAGVDAGTPDAGPIVFMLPDEREPCADRDELRRPFFGDLHVHTSLSFDAVVLGVRARPRDAYRFARGEEVGLPPYDASGTPTRTARIGRPLDFAAVTDHSEFLAEATVCHDPSSPAYDSTTCTSYRMGDGAIGNFGELLGVFLTGNPTRLCATQPELCGAARLTAWTETLDAAEEFYDRTSACEFTTFGAYEWTAAPGGSNLHRNVYFRNRTIPVQPTSFIEAPLPEDLWDAIDGTCLETGTACDAMAIPHNSNIGAGLMFVPETQAGEPYDRAIAERRARMEPLVEIYQHKGSSECVFGLADPLASEDELCRFEQLHPTICRGMPDDPPGCAQNCEDGGIGFIGNCVAPGDFVRGALRNGLAEYARVGVNPFQLGFIASTDTHNAIPGATDEETFPGHQGTSDDDPEEALAVGGQPLVRGETASPGGLAVIWAEENSRDALFDAMRRRETYATSGPRMVVRFFGGDYDAALCSDPNLVRTGYESGVPMGGELPPSTTAPSFVISALRDAMGAPLQRIQIVKGWLAGGTTHERVFEVAGDPENGASVDPTTCEPSGPGSDSLCAVWTDPEFDPAAPAFYYARVIENPTCRWTQVYCNELAVDCATLTSESPLYACCDPARTRTTQERAWTSPIWYLP